MDDCIFCAIIAGEIPCMEVYADDAAIAFLDLAPYKPGHTLVVPRIHVPDALSDADVLASIAPAVTEVGRLLREKLGADGFNLLSNVGEVAGQSVGHLHVHVIPRFDAKPGIEAMLDRDAGIVVPEVFARLQS